MFRFRTWAIHVLLALLCLLAGVGVVTALPADETGLDPQMATPTPENETQQENPANVQRGEYTGETAAWLAARLSGQLENGTVALSNGQYQQARQLLGDDYDRRLDQYVEVAGETESNGDDTATTEFQEASDNTRDLTASVERYRQQYAAYREARENGDEQRARETARKMERTAANVSRQRRRLNRNYEDIGNATSADVEPIQERVNETTANITATQSTVRDATFIGTTLSVQSASQSAAFTDPGELTGQIRTENGSALASRTIELRVGNRPRSVRTDSNGAFETQYRPRTARLGQQSIEVQYVPASESVYLTDNSTVTVNIRQTSPDIEIERAPARVGYGDRLNISATVTAASRPVANVPVEITIGDTTVRTFSTAANGSVSGAVEIPASVPDGNRTLSVRVPYQDRALAGANATVPLVVTETETELSLDASTANGTVLARGRLQTADGRPLPGRRVRVQVGDTDSTAVETDRNGVFETRLADVQINGGKAPVRARFAQPASNLGNASATATVAVGAAGPPAGLDTTSFLNRLWSRLLGQEDSPSVGFGRGGDTFPWGIGGVVVLSVLSSAALVAKRYDQVWRRTETAGTESAETAMIGPELPDDRLVSSGPDLDTRLDAHLDDGEYEAATMLAYRVLHEELTTTTEIPATVTHWELLQQCRDNGLDDQQVATIETIVEAFETAAFAPTAMEPSTAEAAVANAKAIRGNGADDG